MRTSVEAYDANSLGTFLAGVFVMEEGGCDRFRNEGIRCVIISRSTILQDRDVSSCTTVVTNSHDLMRRRQHSFRIFMRSASIVASDRSRNCALLSMPLLYLQRSISILG